MALPRAESIEAEEPGGGPAHVHAGPRTLRPSFGNMCDRTGMNLWDEQPTKKEKLHALRYSSEFCLQQWKNLIIKHYDYEDYVAT